MDLTETTCCDVMMTVANDFRLGPDIPIHGPPMSSLNTLEENDPVLLRITESHHKIPRS